MVLMTPALQSPLITGVAFGVDGACVLDDADRIVICVIVVVTMDAIRDDDTDDTARLHTIVIALGVHDAGVGAAR